jgi:Skp family chaperone for outer membrane proteins
MENEILFESLLQQIADNTTAMGKKLETLTNQLQMIQIDHANFKGEISTQILRQNLAYDQKISELERRFDDRLQRRDEKVDTAITDVKTNMSSISVKVSVVFSVVTLIIGGIIAALAKLLIHA